jgi:subtilisin family serine protease
MLVSLEPGSQFPSEIAAGGVVLVLTRDEVYFEAVEGLKPDEVGAIVAKHRLEPVTHTSSVRYERPFHEAFPKRRWARIIGERSLDRVIDELRADGRVRVANPVYHRPDLPYQTGLSFADRILVKLRPNASAGFDSLAKAAGSKLVPIDRFEQADGVLHRVGVPEPKKHDALDVATRLRDAGDVKDAGPDWLSLTPATTAVPNDPLFAQQWDMTQIAAPQGWDISTGAVSVVIAIVDTGCDLGHEDLLPKYVPVAQRRDIVAATNTPEDDYGHGTCCAGLAAAASNNTLGVAGVAWDCKIMPIRMLNSGYINSEADIVAAIDWARLNGANVVSMSWYWPGPHASADVALAQASAANMVLCAATGNFNNPTIVWPAINPNCMAIGASDQADARKSPASPDGEGWGSNYGPEISVLAPGVLCWAPNNTNGGPSFWSPGLGTPDHKYFSHMNGTSAATPHVAGLAGLLFSAYPALSNAQVRTIIEQTAQKTGGYAYANDGTHNNGTWEQEPGYGRINVFHALDYADVYIKADPGDTGSRPLAGAFWNSSDIIFRNADDNVLTYQPPLRNQDNYVYVRVNNGGPAAARNVTVNARAVRFLGTQFAFPGDFTAVDANHIQPAGIVTSFANLPAGATAVAKFLLTSAQIETIYTNGWHSCFIADVSADNDYGSGDGVNVWDDNNLGQINYEIQDAPAGLAVQFPFVAGNAHDKSIYHELVIDRSGVPDAVELLLDVTPAKPVYAGIANGKPRGNGPLTAFVEGVEGFVERVEGFVENVEQRLERASVITAEADDDDDARYAVTGGETVTDGGRQVVSLRSRVAVIGLFRAPGELREMQLTVRIPRGAKTGDTYRVTVAERNTSGRIVGGVTLAARVS